MTLYQKYWPKYWKLFCLAVVCLMVEAGCDLLQPTMMSRIIDVGVAGGKMDYILRMGALMLGIAGLGALAATGRNILSSSVSQRFGADLRSDLFRRIQDFSFADLDRFETASLVTRLTNDVTQLQNFVNGLMRIFVKAPLLCLGSLIMAALLNLRMALILLLGIPFIGLLMFWGVRVGFPYFRKAQKMIDRVNAVMREYLSGVRVVKAFNRFDYETERFAAANQELTGVSIVAQRIIALFTPTITLTVNLGIVLLLALGGIWVRHGQLHVGQVIAFVNYMTQILISLMMIFAIFNVFVRARASTERIGEVMLETRAPENGPRPSSPLDPQPEAAWRQRNDGALPRVAFERVFFSYARSAGEPVLQNISFSCAPGETVAIIGVTGAGKSSLVNLIPRFYDVTAGAVRVDGIDVRDWDPGRLREKIAVVPQKTLLFTGTLLENIRWGRTDATPQEVERVARTAQAHDFIAALPEGYQTFLGQGGVNLSGGQKQRVAIARALIRRPEILIMDDSTSAVDMATEAAIREAIRRAHAHAQFGATMSCFLITQRIRTAMGADRILVLENGALAGIGSHRELMLTCEVYRDIYRSQIGKEGI